MNSFSIMFAAAAALAASVGIVIPADASQDNPQRIEKADLSGLRDFDFLVGDWRVQHRRLKERLANSQEWQEFDGTCSNRGLMREQVSGWLSKVMIGLAMPLLASPVVLVWGLIYFLRYRRFASQDRR